MAVSRSIDLDAAEAAVLAAFPRLSRRAREAGFALYRLLLEGGAVSPEQVASVVGRATREVLAVLEAPGMRCQLLYDDQKRVIGFGGLTAEPTKHCLRMNGRELFTWCAWDGLFIPHLLGATAELESHCPATGQLLRVRVTPNGTLPVRGEPLMSFLLPTAASCAESTERSISCFCSYVNLLASREVGTTWVACRPDLFVLSLDEAFELGRRYNAARFWPGESGNTGPPADVPNVSRP